MGFVLLLQDFANIFKAFIGVNYLQISFAFKESGLALGLAGVVFISYATIHCCSLIVKCKKEVVRRIIEEPASLQGYVSSRLLNAQPEDIEKHIEYGDVAKASLGNIGYYLTVIALFVTQFGFCIGYFVFLGNTLEDIIFPEPNQVNETIIKPSFNGQSSAMQYHSEVMFDGSGAHYYGGEADDDWKFFTLNLSSRNRNTVYLYLTLIPFPFFVAFAMIRSIRDMGVLSLLANVSVFVGYFSILFHILGDGFHVAEDIVWVNFKTFPIFFGQVTSAYEGIGTIIPIESSMEGSRSKYPLLLNMALILFTLVYASIGVLGYLYFGSEVQQVIIWSIPEGSVLSYVTNITICIGVLLTFPLQNFVVVELIEGCIWGSAIKQSSNESTAATIQSINDQEPLLISGVPTEDVSYSNAKVPWWKRNLVRLSIVVVELGIAGLLRNEYAYLSALIGAIGSTMLAFILPCAIQISLKKNDLHPLILVKDVFFIIFGFAGMGTGVYCSIKEIIKNLSV